MALFDTEKKIALQMMRCPTCGAKLKFEKAGEEIECIYCGNKYIATAESPRITADSVKAEQNAPDTRNIKTSSSAIAFIEQLLDSYDWDGYALTDDFEIDELEAVTYLLRINFADDPKTWYACFLADVVPFAKKISSRTDVISDIIAAHKNDDLDAYGMYDVYKKLAREIIARHAEVDKKARSYIEYAEKYGADTATLEAMRDKLSSIDVTALKENIYEKLEDIPAIKELERERNSKKKEALAVKGIDADAILARAKAAADDGHYSSALSDLYTLDGYSDSNELADKIDDLGRLENIYFYMGHYFVLEKNENDGSQALYRVVNDVKETKPVASGITNVVTSYANILFYFCTEGLRGLDMMTGNKVFECKTRFSKKIYHLTRDKAYFISSHEETQCVYELDFATANVTEILSGISGDIAFRDSYLVYLHKHEGNKKIYHILDLDSKKSYPVSKRKIELWGGVDNKVIFSVNAPDQYNRDLYYLELTDGASPVLLEANVTDGCDIINGKLYYFTIDSSDRRYLISSSPDGSNRRELVPHIKKVLFESGGWVYFIKGYGYNSALYRVRVNGTDTTLIASSVDDFVSIKNGYLYYVDDDRELHQVRMNGTRNKTLCGYVKDVFYADNSKVVYSSLDRVLTTNVNAVVEKKNIYSIYAIDFDADGRRKASYNIREATAVDGDSVYFTSVKTVNKNGASVDVKEMYRLDLASYEITHILTVGHKEEHKTNIALILTVLFAIMTVIGFALHAAVGVLFLIATIISIFFMMSNNAEK